MSRIGNKPIEIPAGVTATVLTGDRAPAAYALGAVPLVVAAGLVAGAGAVLIAGLVVATILRSRPPAASAMIGVGPSVSARA